MSKFTSSIYKRLNSFTTDWQAERNIINILHRNPESQILITIKALKTMDTPKATKKVSAN